MTSLAPTRKVTVNPTTTNIHQGTTVLMWCSFCGSRYVDWTQSEPGVYEAACSEQGHTAILSVTANGVEFIETSLA